MRSRPLRRRSQQWRAAGGENAGSLNDKRVGKPSLFALLSHPAGLRQPTFPVSRLQPPPRPYSFRALHSYPKSDADRLLVVKNILTQIEDVPVYVTARARDDLPNTSLTATHRDTQLCHARFKGEASTLEISIGAHVQQLQMPTLSEQFAA